MGSSYLLQGFSAFFDGIWRSKIHLKKHEKLYTLRVFDGFLQVLITPQKQKLTTYSKGF
jgi:hypothetical protein